MMAARSAMPIAAVSGNARTKHEVKLVVTPFSLSFDNTDLSKGLVGK